MKDTNHKIFGMNFGKLYAALIAKAERKGRTREEVHQVTGWLTSYSVQEIQAFEDSGLTYAEFFEQAPVMNPNRDLITGKICGVQIETIEHPTMKAIRQLDKLVDELAKGRPLEKILR